MKEEYRKRIEEEVYNKKNKNKNVENLTDIISEFFGISTTGCLPTPQPTAEECDKVYKGITDFLKEHACGNMPNNAKVYDKSEEYQTEEEERPVYDNPNKTINNKIAIGSYDDGELLDTVYLIDPQNLDEFNNAIQYAKEHEEDRDDMCIPDYIEEYLDMNQIPYEIIGISHFYCIGDDEMFEA